MSIGKSLFLKGTVTIPKGKTIFPIRTEAIPMGKSLFLIRKRADRIRKTSFRERNCAVLLGKQGKAGSIHHYGIGEDTKDFETNSNAPKPPRRMNIQGDG